MLRSARFAREAERACGAGGALGLEVGDQPVRAEELLSRSSVEALEHGEDVVHDSVATAQVESVEVAGLFAGREAVLAEMKTRLIEVAAASPQEEPVVVS